MKRLLGICLVALGLLAVAEGRAAAQGLFPPTPLGGIGRRGPALSPFLNLRRNTNPAVNYFLGTVPEFDRRQNIVDQNAALLELERRAAAPVAGGVDDLLAPNRPPTLGPSGHATFFNNTGGFFPPTGSGAPAQQGRPRGR